MKKDSCPDHQELAAFALGKLAAQPMDAVAAHLENCMDCLQAVARCHDESDTIVSSLRMKLVDDEYERESALADACQKIEEFDTIQIGRTDPPRAAAPISLPSFGSYRVQRLIGQGGMGAVYSAIHTELNKPVAIKVLSSDRLGDRSSIERFRREMRAVGRLDHQHLVRAMDAGEADGTHFLAMELVYGLDMSDVVKRFGPLRSSDACEIIRQAAIGLAFANQHDMVHRDIKPSNLMLGVQPNQRLPQEIESGSRSISSETADWVVSQPAIVKVMDMGLALLADSQSKELTNTGEMMGTLDYMAPEQISDTHSVDIRADLYSLGASLYRLLTGKTPFHHTQRLGTLAKLAAIANDDAERVETWRHDVPPAVADLVHRMIEKNVDARIQTPSELIESILPHCEGCDLSKLLAKAWSTNLETSAALELTMGVDHSLSDTTHNQGPQVSPLGKARQSKRLVWLLTTLAVFALTGFWFAMIYNRNGSKSEVAGADSEKQSEKVSAKSTHDDSIERIKVTPDGRNGTLTLGDALRQAKPGQTLDLEPGVYSDDDGLVPIDVPGLKIRGNRSTVAAFWKVSADNISIDSVDSWGCRQHHFDGGKIEMTNCRFSQRVSAAAGASKAEFSLKNCVARLGGAYDSQFNIDHCTLIEVPPVAELKHGCNAFEIDCIYRISNSLVMGEDFAFAIDEVKPPRSVQLTHSLLWSKSNNFAAFQDTPESVQSTKRNPKIRSLNDLKGLNIMMTDSITERDPKFQGFFERDFRLRAGSPAKGAAEDGTDMGAIPDADGWPLRAMSYKVSAKATHDDSIVLVKVTPDGRNGTLTLADALKQAKPGQTLDLEPGVYSDDDGLVPIDVPGLKIRGNRSTVAAFWNVSADNISIDSVDCWGCFQRLEGGKIELANCRFSQRVAAQAVHTEYSLKNCVARLGTAYNCQFNIDRCTLIEVPPVGELKHGCNVFDTDSIYRISNSLIMGEDFVFAIDEVKTPRSVQLTHSLLWSKSNNFAAFRETPEKSVQSTKSTPEIRSLNDLKGLNVMMTDSITEMDPKFQGFFVRDFRLRAGSPALGAAEDGTDMGAIPDADGWPLKPLKYN